MAPLVLVVGCSLQDFDYLQNGPFADAGSGDSGEAGGMLVPGSGGTLTPATGGAGGGSGGVVSPGSGGSLVSDGGATAAGAGGDVDAGAGGNVGPGSGGNIGTGGSSLGDGGSDGVGGGSGRAGAGGVGPGAGGSTPLSGSGGSAGGTTIHDGGASGEAGSGGAPPSNLVHRYKFDGNGSVVTDSIGSAHGTVVNTLLSNAGTLVLKGGTSNQYVSFPKGILSGLSDASFEIWASWNGGDSYQRMLDFGESQTNDAGSTTGEDFIMVSPSSPDAVRGSYKSVSTGSIEANGTAALASGELCQVVLVLQQSDRSVKVYVNGALAGQASGIDPLSEIHDNNNWLGRSQYSSDPTFAGTYYDFRIYKVALTVAEIAARYQAGPDQ